MPGWLVLQARLYRVRSLFQFLEYNLSFSMLPITIVRNMTVRMCLCPVCVCV